MRRVRSNLRDRGWAISGTVSAGALVLLVWMLVAALALTGCAPKPPEIVSVSITPTLRMEGGWHVVGATASISVVTKNAVKVEFYAAPTGNEQIGQLMHTDSKAEDGFVWNWFVPESTASHVWAKAYNRNGDWVQSQLLEVYREPDGAG